MYSIRVAESKKVLDRVNTYYDAVEVIKEAEIRDKENNEFVEDYYEIYDEARDEIVVDEPQWRYNNQANVMEMLAYDLGVSTENGQTTIVTVGEGCASYLTVDNERAIQLAKFILETIDNDTPKWYTIEWVTKDGQQWGGKFQFKNLEEASAEGIHGMRIHNTDNCFIECLIDNDIYNTYPVCSINLENGKYILKDFQNHKIFEVKDGKFKYVGEYKIDVEKE